MSEIASSQLASVAAQAGLSLTGQKLRRQVFLMTRLIYEPAREIMVLITKATSEGSGEPAHSRSLARAFAVYTHEVWK